MPRWAPSAECLPVISSAIKPRSERGSTMDRFIKFIQAVGVVALVVAITVGYGTVREASATPIAVVCLPSPDYCHDDLRGQYGDHACATPTCNSARQTCCLRGISNEF